MSGARSIEFARRPAGTRDMLSSLAGLRFAAAPS
jgi:hypothetical protein